MFFINFFKKGVLMENTAAHEKNKKAVFQTVLELTLKRETIKFPVLEKSIRNSAFEHWSQFKKENHQK